MTQSRTLEHSFRPNPEEASTVAPPSTSAAAWLWVSIWTSLRYYTIMAPKLKKAELAEPLWLGWRDVYFVGNELHSYADIFKIQWDFNHLEKELEDGKLSEKNVYLFGCTERML